MALAGINYLGALARLLPERDPHEEVYEALTLIADRLDDSARRPGAGRAVRGAVLAECGFAARPFPLRRDRNPRGSRLCVAALGPGSEPSAGAPWRDRLLPLPAFLRDGDHLGPPPSAGEIADGFRMTGFFLLRDVFSARNEPLPDSRRAFLAAMAKAGAD